MRFLKSLLLSYFLFLPLSFGALSHGTYVGVLRYSDQKKEQLAKLDYIFAQLPGGENQIRAVLTLHFGDFSSKEYVSYHFDNVGYNLPVDTYFFTQVDQDIKITSTKATSTEFEAQVLTATGKLRGNLFLKKDRAAQPTLPLIDSVWGEYRGTCSQGTSILQLYPFRSRSSTTDVGNPFGAYEIRGAFAKKAPLCDPTTNPFGRPCITNAIVSGSYNFYDGILNLAGTRNQFECRVESGALICDGCKLKRVSKETAQKRMLAPPSSKPFFLETTPVSTVESPVGEYIGYLHHETLNEYQLGRLVMSVTNLGPGQFRIGASANLYFGSLSEPGLAFSFDEVNYPLFQQRYLFTRKGDSENDAVLEVTSVQNGVAKGVWYSNLFGRVGTFEFRKNGPVSIPSGAKLMSSLATRYEFKHRYFIFDLNLVVLQGNNPPNNRDPFSPLTFSADFWERRYLIPKTNIKGGSFDFYSGRMALFFEGNESGFLVGDRLSNEELRLKWVFERTGVPLEEHDLKNFRYRRNER